MISLTHKTVFVHIPKCGGQSVETAFLADLGLRWKRHRHLLMCMRKPTPAFKGRDNLLAHLRAAEYRDHYLPRRMFWQFYRFALVRDPFRRVESLFAYTGAADEMRFEDYVLRHLPKSAVSVPFLAPQAEYLVDEDGTVMVDDILRLEDIAEGWARVQARSGVTGALPHRNRSNGGAQVWTAPMVASLAETYAADFALLDYPVTPPTQEA